MDQLSNRQEAPRFARPAYSNPSSRQIDPALQKDWQTVLLLCLFLGLLGAHRFYTGYTTIGLIQLCTAGGLLLWWILDIIEIAQGKYVDAYGRPLRR